jgi:hypothetical protein
MDPVVGVGAAAAVKAAKKIKKRKAGDKLQEKTPEATKAKEVVENGSKDLDKYISYLDNYDRKARGAGSSRGTDRLSALDLDRIFKAGKDFGISKEDRASEVLQYARRVEDDTKMGGASERYLDKLRGMLGKSSEDSNNTSGDTAPVNPPKSESEEPEPEPPEATEPKPPTTSVSGDVTVNPIRIPDRDKTNQPSLNGYGSSQIVNQGNHYGQITTGHITNNSGTINMSNDNNSTNTVEGGDYRPSFMRFMRK